MFCWVISGRGDGLRLRSKLYAHCPEPRYVCLCDFESQGPQRDFDEVGGRNIWGDTSHEMKFQPQNQSEAC